MTKTGRMTPENYNYILLDLDGTVIDSAEGITRSVQYALAHFGIDVKDLSTLHCFIGPPLKESFMEFYHFDGKQAEEATEKYRERYAIKGLYENKVYDGIETTIQQWSEVGKKVMLCTSKPEEFAKKILEGLNLLKYFDFVGGATFDGTRNQKVEVIEYVLAENNIVDRSQVVMVGDRKYDIVGAKQAGLDSVGVLYGFGDREEFQAAGADYIVETPRKLADLLT